MLPNGVAIFYRDLGVLVNTALLVLLLGSFIWLLIHSRRWTAPIQAEMLRTLRAEVDMVRNRISVVERDVRERTHTTVEDVSRIWEELRRMNVRLDEIVAAQPRRRGPYIPSDDEGGQQ